MHSLHPSLASTVCACTVLLFLGRLQPTLGYLAAQSPLRIDCGASSDQVIGGIKWQADRYYESGSLQSISSSVASQNNLTSVQATLRVFPIETPGCYKVPVAIGRYLIRLGFTYFNYDKLRRWPYFDVLVQGTLVKTVDTSETDVLGGSYFDFIAFAPKKNILVCLAARLLGSIGNPTPSVLNSLEILPVDTDAYQSIRTGQDIILSNFLRLNLGGPACGPEPEDPGYRMWAADDSQGIENYIAVNTSEKVTGTGIAPDYLPETIFQTAWSPVEALGDVAYHLPQLVPVNISNSWLLNLYFAELNVTAKQGSRVFDIKLGDGDGDYDFISDRSWGFDILNQTKLLNAYTLTRFFRYKDYIFGDGQEFVFGVFSRDESKLPALINAAELYEVIRVTQDSPEGKSVSHRKSGLSGGSIAAIILSVVLVIVLVGGFYIYKRSNRHKFTTFNDSVL